jgi:Mg2+-importing ATPase
MKKTIIQTAKDLRIKRIEQDLAEASVLTVEETRKKWGCSDHGLSQVQAEDHRAAYGRNILSKKEKRPAWQQFLLSFASPFTFVLMAIAAVSAVTDIITAAPQDRNPFTVILISLIILLSGVIRFVQERRSDNATETLHEMIKVTACIERKEDGEKEIPVADIVCGDLVHLSAGDIIPADLRIISARDLFLSQAALTGESAPVEKLPDPEKEGTDALDCQDLAFMGTTVLSGTAEAIAIGTRDATLIGELNSHLNEKRPQTSFEKGVNAVSVLLIRFMAVMVPIVFLLNGFTKGNWISAGLFAISVAVGLTPEMLPMIMTTCLAKGAVTMSKEKVIVKNLNAIQNLGSMDLLCTDKTGTLTQDQIVLEYHLDIAGKADDRVLRHAFLNSYYQTGLKNLMDIAIIEATKKLDDNETEYQDFIQKYKKVDEIPFDFERRRMSVLVSDETGKTQLITKGALEEMLQISSQVEYGDQIMPLTEEMRQIVRQKACELNREGMRVLAVAQKNDAAAVGQLSAADESEMILIGYLAFLDPPKETAAPAIQALDHHGVKVKVLTGDSENVTAYICGRVGLQAGSILLGEDLDRMNEEEFSQAVEKTDVFAKLSPLQKARVVSCLRRNGHHVGYMGDGINDAAAMRASDVGISVDTAVDIAKESADIILLQKDLMVLDTGIREGRRTYGNLIKYIKMTASSNFGNTLSVLMASAFLPFLPMAALHLILLNLIYDISCTAIPWDNVDEEFEAKPRQWNANGIGSFMLWMGPVSSVFDIATYLLMFFVICPPICGGTYGVLDASGKALFISLFQTGWFIESMWSQTLVIHMIRTAKIPFLQSRASWQLSLLSLLGIAFLTIIPYTDIGTQIGLHALPAYYFAWLAALVLGYMSLATIVKKLYIHHYHELL